ncbi:unnamed protein product [Onchocerca flexuosa]|uniref:Uncharacterized protein n=1 Tax=Onchocerca flexuosa TaxID=387005 RepID=A0A183HEQ5_9BILA|nr:unnamed protein product [Onchocerca flexuosa]
MNIDSRQQPLDLMWKRYSTRISSSQCGMLVVCRNYVVFGNIIL